MCNDNNCERHRREERRENLWLAVIMAAVIVGLFWMLAVSVSPEALEYSGPGWR